MKAGLGCRLIAEGRCGGLGVAGSLLKHEEKGLMGIQAVITLFTHSHWRTLIAISHRQSVNAGLKSTRNPDR